MEKINQSKSVFTISGRHRFVACVIIVILVSCAAFAYLACCYKQAQDDIVALQRKDALVFAASCLMIIFLVFSLYSTDNDDAAKGSWCDSAITSSASCTSNERRSN